MAQISYSFVPQVGYTGSYRVAAFSASQPSVEAGHTDVAYPFQNPLTVLITVATIENHNIVVTALECNRIVGNDTVTP